LSDLINDFSDMVKLKTTSEDEGKIMEDVLNSLGVNDNDAPLGDAGGMLSKEKQFRQAMYDEYIKPRSVALNAMKKGIMLHGTHGS
jgi:hypothetical protein